MTEQFPSGKESNMPIVSPEQLNPSEVIEIEVMPGVYEVYDKATGELVDIGGGEEEA